MQLFEEVLGSSLQKFNESHKEILICDYFGKRTLKIIDYIFNEKVKKLIDNGYQVLATGHSLGGAMAQTFMYFALIQNRIKKNNYPMIITFCQPKVGNIFFADYIDKNTFSLRFLNGKDIVPSIPKFSYNFFSFFKYIIRYDLNSCQYKHTKEEKNMIILDEGITLRQIFKFFLLFIIFVICIISFDYVIYYLKKEYILYYDFGMIKIFYYNLDYNIIALSFFICIIAIVLFYLKNVFKVIWIWGAYKTLIVLIFFLFLILNELFNTIIAFFYFFYDFFPFIFEFIDIFLYNCYANFYNYFWFKTKMKFNLESQKIEQKFEFLAAMIFLGASSPKIEKELQNIYKDSYDKYIKSHSESPKREIEMTFEKDLLKEFEEKKNDFFKKYD